MTDICIPGENVAVATESESKTSEKESEKSNH